MKVEIDDANGPIHLSILFLSKSHKNIFSRYHKDLENLFVYSVALLIFEIHFTLSTMNGWPCTFYLLSVSSTVNFFLQFNSKMFSQEIVLDSKEEWLITVPIKS